MPFNMLKSFRFLYLGQLIFSFLVFVAFPTSGKQYSMDPIVAGTPRTPSSSFDGFSREAAFNHPFDIAVDKWSSHIFIADTDSHAIRRISSCLSSKRSVDIPWSNWVFWI
jgi:hypothetical protein